MKILMIAPEPFFEPRGTPFSEYFRIKALTELGHEIDLATYPIGQNKEIPGLKIYRSLRVPFVRRVKVGPSIAKIFLDFFLFFTVLRLLLRNKYHCIHTHEEACFMGAVLSRLWRLPHVYDMHSSLSQQFANFDVTQATWIHRILEVFERYALRSSDAVIAICPYLGDYARKITSPERVFVIENTPEADTALRPHNPSMSVPAEYQQHSIILYAGTFEAYQGLDLLIESVPFVVKERPDALFLLVGGDRNSIDLLKKKCDGLGVSRHVKLLEKVPVEEISGYLDLARVLVSPRKSGTNTPLKIYSYLRSGKPIVATDLVTHTQVLNAEIAILTAADPQSFGAGILKALSDPGVTGMVQRAERTAEEKYSYREYIAKTSRLYAYIGRLKEQNHDLNPAHSNTAV